MFGVEHTSRDTWDPLPLLADKFNGFWKAVKFESERRKAALRELIQVEQASK